MRKNHPNLKMQLNYGGLTDESGKWNGTIRTVDANLDIPLRVKKPTVWAVWNDLFHPAVPEGHIDRALAVAALTECHTYIILTKHPVRMSAYFSVPERRKKIIFAIAAMGYKAKGGLSYQLNGPGSGTPESKIQCVDDGSLWPLPNVWLGVTAESNKYLWRIEKLLKIPAALHVVSYEPALGPLNLRGNDYDFLEGWEVDVRESIRSIEDHDPRCDGSCKYCPVEVPVQDYEAVQVQTQRIGWVFAGGESGPGARPSHPDSFRTVRDDCAATRTSFLFKQWGEWLPFAPFYPGIIYKDRSTGEIAAVKTDGRTIKTAEWSEDGDFVVARVGKKAAGRLLDGREHNEIPEVAWK